jgi:1-acyl-sn-glycerol-3-phosphate acyltransferase
MNKPFSQRYQLQEFGNGFMRLALQTNTPIVPVAVVGSEEQAPSLGSFAPRARLLSMLAFPLVLTLFPFPRATTLLRRTHGIPREPTRRG